MGQALYRKYRSKSLKEIVGQEHITQTLASTIKSGRISHAYLFTGPHGVGKTSIARILAHEINKLPYTDKTHLDIIEIDAASNRRIDDIRDLRDKVHTAPASAKYKVYIIDEVHMLTGESFNALLKTLEEPPAHVVFILATTEVHKLPATIISRTQRFSFKPAETTKLIAHLKHIAKQEKITIDDEALQLIAEHGAGSYRNSISLLDQLANSSDGTITTERVEQTLGLAPRQAILELVEAISAKNHNTIAKVYEQLEAQGAHFGAVLPQLVRALQAAAQTHPELYVLIDSLLEVPRAYNPQLKLLTTLMSHAINNQNTPSSNKPSVATPQKPLVTITKPVLTKPKKSAPTPEPAQPTIKLDQLTPEQWAQVVTNIKTVSPPLYSIIRTAQPEFLAEQQLLTLHFKFQLHARKMDDSKNKNLLAKTCADLLGGAPAITIVLNPDAQAAVIPDTQPQPEVDQTAAAVIATMGGGEVVPA